MSCTRPYGFVYPACSGHASECLHDKCICHPGWTSFGDFQLTEGYDCSINKLAVVIWSGINGVVCVISLAIILFCVYSENMWTREKFFKEKNMCYLSFITLNISGLVYSIVKVVDQDSYAFGNDILSTIIGIFVVTSVCAAGSSFVLMIGIFLKGYSRMLDKKRRDHFKKSLTMLRRILPVAPLLIMLGFMPIFITPLYMKEQSDKFCATFMAAIAGAYAVYAVCVEYIIHVFQVEVSSYLLNHRKDSISSVTNTPNITLSNRPNGLPIVRPPSVKDTLQAIYQKLRVANYVLIFTFVCGVGLNVTFASWIFLRKKSQYLNCFQETMLQITAPAVCLTIANLSSRFKVSSEISSRISDNYANFSPSPNKVTICAPKGPVNDLGNMREVE